jgi:putative toxin-antitoxin system antitoxin component (TIGR02293 family)
VSPDVGRRLELVDEIRGGFSFAQVAALAKEAGVATDELIASGIIPRRTFTHSKQNQRFTPAQSARLARFFRIQQKAKGTFGSAETAMQWLKRPTKPLHDNAPVSLLDTEEGARLVEDLLTRIDHGIAA